MVCQRFLGVANAENQQAVNLGKRPNLIFGRQLCRLKNLLTYLPTYLLDYLPAVDGTRWESSEVRLVALLVEEIQNACVTS